MSTDRGADVAAEHRQYQDGLSNTLKRSPHWGHVRDQFLKAHPACAASGVTTGLEVHHIIPFHLCVLLGRGYAELDPRNLIVLSSEPIDYHLIIGHMNDFKSFNPHVRHVGKEWVVKPDDQIMKAAAWLTAHLHRPRDWDHMTEHDKEALRAFIDHHYPIHDAAAAPATVKVPA